MTQEKGGHSRKDPRSPSKRVVWLTTKAAMTIKRQGKSLAEARKRFRAMKRKVIWHQFSPFLMLIGFTAAAAFVYLTVEKTQCSMGNGNGWAERSDNDTLPDHDEHGVPKRNLTYVQALHFVFTLATTIGYGDITPCSSIGRCLTVIIAITTIPLSLLCTSIFGKWLSHCLHYLWGRCHPDRKIDTELIVDGLPNFHRIKSVPLAVGVAIAIFWVLLCSTYFHFTLANTLSEDGSSYSFSNSVYFTLISLLTIGLGDFAPLRYDLVVPTYMFIFVGLALVAMCIDIVRTKLEVFFDDMTIMIEKEYRDHLLKMQERRNTIAALTRLTIPDQALPGAGKAPVVEADEQMVAKGMGKLWKKHSDSIWLAPLMNQSQKRRLIMQYQKKANMVCVGTQTEVTMETRSVDCQSFCDSPLPGAVEEIELEKALEEKVVKPKKFPSMKPWIPTF